MTTTPKDFPRNALLEGSKTGKLPTPSGRKWGWWFWPISTVAVATGTYWGAQHIERQVEAVAPTLLAEAGIDPSGLEFDATYRHVNVGGTLPAGTTSEQIQLILAKSTGANDESIRSANVQANSALATKVYIAPPAVEPIMPAVPVVTEPEPESKSKSANIEVAAMVIDQRLALVGSVPSQSHATILTEAAQLAFNGTYFENHLTVAELPAAIEDADGHINYLAALISNMNGDVIHAELNLDNENLTGKITTVDSESQIKYQAMVPANAVTVTSAAPPPALELPPEAPTVSQVVPTTSPDQTTLLQSEIALLSEEIKEAIIFAPSSDELPPAAFAVLEKIALAMNNYPEPNVEISGHTDSQSSAESNITLSEKRANAVATYIAMHGVDSHRLIPIGYGESNPLVSNDTAANRAKNRRVEFLAHLYN